MKKHSSSGKILLVATAGGHLQELMACKEVFENYDYTIMTDKMPWTEDLDRSILVPRLKGKRFFILRTIIYMLNCFFFAVYIILFKRPVLIITTGSEIALPIIYLGKVFRVKSIYIESLTCFEKPSLTAKLVLPVADLFYAQQPELVDYAPDKIKFKGNIL